jgi:hypothetical protein
MSWERVFFASRMLTVFITELKVANLNRTVKQIVTGSPALQRQTRDSELQVAEKRRMPKKQNFRKCLETEGLKGETLGSSNLPAKTPTLRKKREGWGTRHLAGVLKCGCQLFTRCRRVSQADLVHHPLPVD